MSPSTGRPTPPRVRAGGRAAASTAAEGLCDRPEPKAEDGGGEHEHWRQPMSRSEAEGLLCDPEPQGEPTRSRRPAPWR
jgi:hypothetical protein